MSFSLSPSSYLVWSSVGGMSSMDWSSSCSSSSSETSWAWLGLSGKASRDFFVASSYASGIFVSSWTPMLGCSSSSRSKSLIWECWVVFFGGEASRGSSVGFLPPCRSLCWILSGCRIIRMSVGRMTRWSDGRVVRRVIAAHMNNFFGTRFPNTLCATMRRKLSHDE